MWERDYDSTRQKIEVLTDEIAFDGEYYLQHNLDVAKANINPLRHYINYGKGGGRVVFMTDLSNKM